MAMAIDGVLDKSIGVIENPTLDRPGNLGSR
jgi:hypothetical protein